MTTASTRSSQPLETLVDLVATFRDRGAGPALVAFRRHGTVTVSYAELGESVARAAQGLRQRGVAPGDRVALLGPNCPEWVVACFAIVAAGAVAVPLDPQTTLDTIDAELGHVQPVLMITTAARRAELERLPPLTSARFLLLDDDGSDGINALARETPSADLARVAPTDLASLLFTSGTTGTPKAVPLTHGNFAANTRELLAAKLLGARDRVLVPLPLHHTYPFTVGLLTPLATGATVILPAGISGPEIAEACSAGRATALLAVPRLCTAVWDSILAGARARGTVAARLFEALLAASIALRRYTGVRVGRWLFRAVHARLGGALRIIGCGGAKLAEELAWNLEGLGWRVLTGYGLTETSPVLTFNHPGASRLGSEGRPLPGVEVRIAGSDSDVPGEIQARGPSVFARYWDNPEATATTFTSDGWFRTGDLGKFDERGFLRVVGRSKELIVLADGKKFFPEPVEKLYNDDPLLREVGVFERGGKLAAVVVPDEEEIRKRGALRQAAALREQIEDIAARLPPYQRITEYRIVRTPLPRTQLGKLRRHLLPQLFAGAEHAHNGAPAELEAADRALVETPLGRKVWQWLRERYPDRPLTLDTSPQLDLGVDSLEWVALTVEIERSFGAALNAEHLSRVLTLRDLLHEIETAAAAGGSSAAATPRYAPPGAAMRALGAVVYVVVRLLVRLVLRLRVEGRERLPDGPALITPNHASYLDPLVVAAALPWRRLRRTYWAGWVGVMHTSPLRRALSRSAQVFPVDPDRDLAAAIRTARELLAAGHSVVWFPEGRRSPTGELEKFQAGIGLLLQNQQIAAVPTAIEGTFSAWPKHRRWPRRGARVGVTFGSARAFAADLPAATISDQLAAAVAELLGVCPPSGFAADTSPPRGESEMTTPVSEVTLRDGRRATIRPIRRDDIARTGAFIDGLSAQSKHTLFLGGVTRLGEAALRRLCAPDDGRDMAYVAVAADAEAAAEGGERQIGVARYAGADSAEGAEISVAVADDWQHQGLGKMLLERLIEHARNSGVRRLYSMDAVTNAAMRRLARDMGFTERPDPDDIHQVIYSLDLVPRP
jgi:long-chain acyl-CoA synthetase